MRGFEKFVVLLILAIILPGWSIGFLLIGVPVLLILGGVFGGGAYGLIRGFKNIWRD